MTLAGSPARLELPDGTRHALVGACWVGRASGNDIVLAGDEVSRQHALFHLQGRREVWLIDMGSSNGTLLNDRHVIQPVRLNDRDRIAMGEHTLVYHAPPRPPTDGSRKTLARSTVKRVNVAAHWLLVADICGFTPMSKSMKARDLAQLTGKWLSRCREIVDARGGAINKYLGDGFLAMWQREPSTTLAVNGALNELSLLQAREDPPFRLALHCGDVTMSKFSSSGAVELLGPDVNYLFRMEKLAASLQVPCLLSEAAVAGLESSGTINLGLHPLKGFDGSQPFYGWDPR